MKRLVLALGLGVLAAQAQQDSVDLAVIIRDFSVTHDDFEVFDAAWPTQGLGDRQCAEDKPDGRGVEGGTYICQDYKACSESDVPTDTLSYGQMSNHPDIQGSKRGYINEMKAEGWKTLDWSQKVMVTKGMVAPTLDYSQVPATATNMADSALYARPRRLRENSCHNTKFDEWFTDVKGVNKRIEDNITLAYIGNNQYEISADRNNELRGYFPLEKYADGSKDNYGRQSLAIWCRPDFGWQEAFPLEEKEENGEALSQDESAYLRKLRQDADYPDPGCAYWMASGGAKDPGAAKKAAEVAPNLLGDKLRNYGFTMAGVAIFKFNPAAQDSTGEIFEFVGDDDMWIFIDGELVVDLGGTHVAAPARINMNEVAASRGGWEKGSKHVLNFYYADRQSDGSNMKIKMSLSGLLSSPFGAPNVSEAKTEGNLTYLYVDKALDESTFKAVMDGGYFPILVRRASSTQADAYDTLGYKATSFSYSATVAKGVVYKLEGYVCGKGVSAADCTEGTDLATNDSLTFNYPYIEAEEGFVAGLNLPDDKSLSIKATNGKAVTKASWGRNATSLEKPDGTVDQVDPTVVKPDFNINGMNYSGTVTPSVNPGAVYTGTNTPVSLTPANLPAGVAAPKATVVTGFGSAGTKIPASQAGELILTNYPAGKTSMDEKIGLPPQATAGSYGLIDPTVSVNGAYSYVKNGFANESNTDGSYRVSPTRCTSNSAGNVNCLSFTFPAVQPFKLNVTVYDHLGHYISSYQQTVTPEDFRNVTQGATLVDPASNPVASGDACKYTGKLGDDNNLVQNGKVRVSVNVYPLDETGRRIGNGVYIVKVDRIDYAFTGCFNNNGVSAVGEYEFVRYHDEYKLGWMRSK